MRAERLGKGERGNQKLWKYRLEFSFTNTYQEKQSINNNKTHDYRYVIIEHACFRWNYLGSLFLIRTRPLLKKKNEEALVPLIYEQNSARTCRMVGVVSTISPAEDKASCTGSISRVMLSCRYHIKVSKLPGHIFRREATST